MEIDVAAIASFMTGQAAHNKRVEDMFSKLVLAPRREWVTADGIINASTVAMLDLGGPRPGMVWEVKNIQVGPTDYTQPFFAGSVKVVVFGGTPGDLGPNAAMGGYSNQWPAQGFFGREEFIVTSGKRLRVYISGPLAGSPVMASAMVLQSALDTTGSIGAY